MYKVKGADQKEYGPISAEQVRQWIAENRLNRFSLASDEASPGWKPLGQFPEFAEGVGMGASSTSPPANTIRGVPAEPGGVISSSPGSALPPSAMATPGVPDPNLGAYFAGNREGAQRAVNGPAVAMIVCAVLGVIMAIGSAFISLLWGGSAPNIPDENVRRAIETWKDMSKGLGFFSSLLSLPWNGFILWSALKMQKLESYPVCLTGAILTLLPCFSGCCCVSIPVGIWALVVINKPEVRAHFR
ncbi:MAG: DUF4339 domain-containing protein [Pedosphaera sp.]|nr:DUF4339 domain-containing protein [Pedosphaera sp.]